MRYLFADDVFVSEADGFAQVVLRLNGPAEGTFTVNYVTSNGYASSSLATDYTAVNSSVTFTAGESSKTIQIAITNNLVAEPFENFVLNLAVPVASQNLVTLTRAEIPVWIVDNDSTQGGTPIVSVGDVIVDEATSQVARFAVTLDRPAVGTVTVNWTTANGSALAGQDFVGATGTLTFVPGDTAQTVEVALIDDALAEGSEQFRLQLTGASGATVGVGEAVATIGANDAQVSPRPVLYADEVTVSEADGYAEVVLRLDAPSASPIRVNYVTSNGYASSSLSTDYIAQNSFVTFAPGQTVHTVKVPINTNDNAAERTENFVLNLAVPAASQNLVTLTRAEIPVWIVDNDSTQGGTPIVTVGDVIVDEATSQYARFVVTLDRPAVGIVTVNWATANGSALAGQDFVGATGTLTFVPGDTAQTVEVALIDDALAEGSEQFRLQLTGASGATVGVGEAVATIGANDAQVSPRPVLYADEVTVSEADGYAEVVLRLDAPSMSPIRVNYVTSNGYASSSLSTDYIAQNSFVIFAPGQTVHTVKVPINTNDNTAERTENFVLNLAVPAASQPLVTLTRSEIPVWIVDNDSTQGGTPIVSVGDVIVDEATSQYARFAVTLDRPALGIVTVNWATANGSALAGQDFVGATGTLTFMPGDTSQIAEVALINDNIPEVAEQFDLRLTGSVGATIGVRSATATIAANDGTPSPRPVLRVDDVAVSEADGYAELVLRLDAPSASPITVNYVTSNGTASSSLSTDYIAQNSSVTFAPGQTVHAVQVPITDDGTAEAQEFFNFNLSVPAASANLVTLSRPQVLVTIVDDDSGFRILSQGMGDDTYVVTAATDRIVEVPWGGVDTVETALNEYTLPDNVENLRMLGGANLAGNGNALDNTFFGNSGDNTFRGGAGFDVVEFSVPAAFYQFDFRGDGSIVAHDTSGQAGTDTLISIEGARFPDLGFLEIGDVVLGRDRIGVFADTITGQVRFTTSAPEQSAWLADPRYFYLQDLQFTLPLYGPFAPPGTTPIFRFYDPVGEQYFWTSDAAVRDSFLATQPQLRYEGAVAQGYASQFDALMAGALGLPIYSVADQRAGGVGTFVLNTIDGVAGLVGQPGVVGGVAFWL